MTTAISQRASQADNFLGELIAKRRKLIDALDANKGEVNLDIFEDFYPDRAHFVYELLQNAEDAGATKVTFALSRDRLVCEHDGCRTFTEADVTAITGIYSSTKEKATDRIGKFGVGFKSVFVYTQSPTVRSGEFSFRIVEMILPDPIAPDPSIGSRTRFEFPFDNPKKPPQEAYAEIAVGLGDLDETTLLFLSSLQAISWKIDGGGSGEVLRHAHSESHFEIPETERRRDDRQLALPQIRPVGWRPLHPPRRHCVSARLSGRACAPSSPESRSRSRCGSSRPTGRVAVFFTAAKETSGLLFHLHGPFVPELSRASIKETPANEPLFKQLAELAGQVLHEIKDLGLLTPEFLAILPNQKDQIPPRYRPIRDAIIAEMRSAPLTPTHDRKHAAAKRLIQAKASLKNLLSEADIEFLVDYDDDPPLWAIGATQRNSRIDDFLDGLKIQEWGIDEFVGKIGERRDHGLPVYKGRTLLCDRAGQGVHAVAGTEVIHWLQQFYALLHDKSAQSGLSYQLKNLKIVCLHGSAFGVASQCYFENDHTDDGIPTVDAAVYTSGKSKPQQEKAKKFLTDLGVRELGEAEEVELILKARYTKEAPIPDRKAYLRDLRRFMALAKQQPEKAKLFASYFIFHGDDDQWHTPAGNLSRPSP